MNVLDLFSGIGGFSLGLERAGMKTVAFCEVDKKCQQVLKKHWPDVPIFDDVSTLTGEEIGKRIEETIDVICGGFPCQDISLAGKGAGLEGKRSGLWTEFHRLIKEIRPKYAIIENVSALRSRGLDQVLREISEIGYDAEWHCIPASAVGAPHRRDRVWIVAYPRHRGGRDSITGSLGRDGERELEERIRTTETIETTGSSQTSESVAYAKSIGNFGELRKLHCANEEEWQPKECWQDKAKQPDNGSSNVANANDSGSGTSRNGNHTKRSETIEGWEEQSLNRSGGSSANVAYAKSKLSNVNNFDSESSESSTQELGSSGSEGNVFYANDNGSHGSKDSESNCSRDDGDKTRQNESFKLEGSSNLGQNFQGSREEIANVSNANNERLEGREWNGQRERREVLSSERQDRSEMGSEAGRIDRVSIQDNVANTNSERLEGRREITRRISEELKDPSYARWWAFEPDVGRVAHGVPNRVDRLKQLGNAVVPQIPQLIGMAIMEREKCLHG
jgi:DNA-cytosine methyltransferase